MAWPSRPADSKRCCILSQWPLTQRIKGDCSVIPVGTLTTLFDVLMLNTNHVFRLQRWMLTSSLLPCLSFLGSTIATSTAWATRLPTARSACISMTALPSCLPLINSKFFLLYYLVRGDFRSPYSLFAFSFAFAFAFTFQPFRLYRQPPPRLLRLRAQESHADGLPRG